LPAVNQHRGKSKTSQAVLVIVHCRIMKIHIRIFFALLYGQY